MFPENYHQMNLEERKHHWSSILSRGMRWAGEDGLDEKSIFDIKLISDLRNFDKDIDLLMPRILTNLAMMEMEDPDKFIADINTRMQTNYLKDEDFVGQHDAK